MYFVLTQRSSFLLNPSHFNAPTKHIEGLMRVGVSSSQFHMFPGEVPLGLAAGYGDLAVLTLFFHEIWAELVSLAD